MRRRSSCGTGVISGSPKFTLILQHGWSILYTTQAVVHHNSIRSCITMVWGGGVEVVVVAVGWSCVRAIMRKEDVGKVSLAVLLLLSSLGSEKEEMLHCTAPNYTTSK